MSECEQLPLGAPKAWLIVLVYLRAQSFLNLTLQLEGVPVQLYART
jgi:hypothetical protein